MDHVVGGLVRRGVNAAHASYRASAVQDEPIYKLPAWGAAVLISTVMFFILMIMMVS
jgi:hypothetical protein